MQGDFGDPCSGEAISTLADIKAIDWPAFPLVACRWRGSNGRQAEFEIQYPPVGTSPYEVFAGGFILILLSTGLGCCVVIKESSKVN
jgi:hypothetical protein